MDTLLFGLGVTVVGMLIVFFGLIVLIGLIKLVTKFSGEAPKAAETKAKAKTLPAPAAAVAAPAVSASTAPAAASAEASWQDGAMIAVITAALTAAMGSDAGFVVRRVRRISYAPAWQRAGREEQIYSRF